jgi:hypothetical protein
MTIAADAESLIEKFEQRTTLLAEVLELAQRQRRCLEQGKTGRLDRLVGRRELALRQWRRLERELGPELEAARGSTLSAEQKVRLRALVDETENLVDAIVREEEGLDEAISACKADMTDELDELRKGRAALRAYAGKTIAAKHPGLDRNA